MSVQIGTSVQDCFGLIAQAQLNVIELSAGVPLTGESLHSGQRISEANGSGAANQAIGSLRDRKLEIML